MSYSDLQRKKLLWQTPFSVFGFSAFCAALVISRLMAGNLLISKFVMFVFLFRSNGHTDPSWNVFLV